MHEPRVTVAVGENRVASAAGLGSYLRNIGRVLYLRLERHFFFLQLLRSSLRLKLRCRETTEDDVASCNDDVCVRNPGSPQRYVLAFCENGHVRNMPKRRFA